MGFLVDTENTVSEIFPQVDNGQVADSEIVHPHIRASFTCRRPRNLMSAIRLQQYDATLIPPPPGEPHVDLGHIDEFTSCSHLGKKPIGHRSRLP